MSLMRQLLDLHQVNAQLLGLQGRLDGARRFLDAQQSALDQCSEQERELRSQIRQLEATAGNLEGEGRGLEDRIAKLRVDLNASRNDRQYQAILADMKLLQGKRDEVESLAIAQLERIDSLRTRLAEAAAAMEAQQAVRDRAAEDFAQRRADVSERLEELTAERARTAALLPESVRVLFDRISRDTDGEAMAPVEEVSRRHREYACGACNLEIPKESFSQLAGAGQAIVQCKACCRILYIPQDLELAVTK
jgi:predicted  nucleic acid-binding Zn-ribbon protein